MNARANESLIAWLPDLIYIGGKFESGRALVCDPAGLIVTVAPVAELRDEKRMRLANRALLPGMVNAHSHAFQRVLRGIPHRRARQLLDVARDDVLRRDAADARRCLRRFAHGVSRDGA